MAYFGELEYRELSQLAKLAFTRRNPRGRRVFVLPGIMGSRLGLVARRSYSLLHPTALANGELTQLAIPGPRALRAVGVMLPGYLKLRLRLEIAGFRPLFCPFDWRHDVERLARSFAQMIERSGERKALVVGHSMGGLVARAALAHDETADRETHSARRASDDARSHRCRRCAPSARPCAKSQRSTAFTPRAACAHAPRHLSDAAVTRRSGRARPLDPRRYRR